MKWLAGRVFRRWADSGSGSGSGRGQEMGQPGQMREETSGHPGQLREETSGHPGQLREETSGHPGQLREETDGHSGHSGQPGQLREETSGHPEHPGHPGHSAPHSILKPKEIAFISCIISVISLLSAISSPIYLPVIPELQSYFHVSTQKINLSVTVYSVFQGLGPTLWAPLSDKIGRRPVYLLCLTVFTCSNVGLALCHNYGQLVALRCLQSGGIAATIAIGGGVVADMTTRANRGAVMSLYQADSVVGAAFGPLIGGSLAQSADWRVIFWFLAAGSLAVAVLMVLALPETQRRLVGDFSRWPAAWYSVSPYIWVRRGLLGVPGGPDTGQGTGQGTGQDTGQDTGHTGQHSTPLLRILSNKETWIVLVPIGMIYTTWFMAQTAFSSLLHTQYGFSSLQIGLAYISTGLGSLIGSILTSYSLQWFYKREARRAATPNIHRARLDGVFVFSAIMCVFVLVFAWTVASHIHYMVPVTCNAVIAASGVYCVSAASVIMVDLFPSDPAAASAALNLVRCLMFAAGFAALDGLQRALTTGGCFSLVTLHFVLGFVAAGESARTALGGPETQSRRHCSW